jgi:hypothetical protein
LRKASFFLILLLTSLTILIILLIVAFLSTPTVAGQSGWVNNMWSCMGDWMSGRYPVSDPYWNLFGVSLIVLVGLVIVGIGGVVYFQVYPEIAPPNRTAQKLRAQESPKSSQPLESIYKTLTDDERKILEVLMSHEGKYLQKYIRKEAGLSRLKTHRVLSRLAERGIVTLKKTGNTNQVNIADWLKK